MSDGQLRLDARLLLILVAFLILATAASAYVTFLIFGAPADQRSARAEQAPVVAGQPELGPTASLGQFTVNLASEGRGPRFARADVVVEVDSGRAQREVERRLPQVRDRVIAVMRLYSPDQVATDEGLRQLRSELRDAIDTLLQEGKAVDVFFTEFVVQ